MLDTDTKRRIDTARDILVGKVPDPKSQVEQITIALIYKFMDDMDAESEELGGKRKFFANQFVRYGWANLMHAGLGGFEILNLYAEAIAKMPENPGIPPLFRDIFKNAYLPYRDPETLKMFLKIIDEFNYDHSERLGDAFEYLLSVLGSQGDAGQFRTPRHIIDFMVEVIDPKKTETVLDPACGTAGFLISSYKHILKANTDVKGHSTLTPDEKGRLAQNFRGYDISPDMVRLSLVNMYLHGFADPHIYEYDTLSSQDKWNEYADVILANPPFMSPKGGIKWHSLFSVHSKRSEVLFVDYMAEHLTPTGRAAIIVPEGIIFTSQTAYTQLRKLLVEEYLVAVISLPAGVFNPYSGVKTSILILDKSLAKKIHIIAFFRVENDGFGLGAQRRAIDKSDLPSTAVALEAFRHSREGTSSPNVSIGDGNPEEFDPNHYHNALVVEKTRIAANGDYNLSGERYRENGARASAFPLRRFEEVCTLEYGASLPKEKRIDGPYPVVGSNGITGYHNEYIVAGPAIIVGRKGSAGEITLIADNCFPIDTTYYVKQTKPSESDIIFLYWVLKSLNLPDLRGGAGIPGLNRSDVYNACQIPLPPLDVQKEIVAEIQGCQKVIDGARAVLDNYRPHISIHPDWPMVELGEAVEILDSKRRPITKHERKPGPYPYYGATGVLDYVEDFLFDEPLVLVGEDGAKWGSGENTAYAIEGKTWVNNHAHVLRPIRTLLLDRFLITVLNEMDMNRFITGVTVPKLNQEKMRGIPIPLPPLAMQQAIVAEIEAEQVLVAANLELIARFEKKIQAALARVWGEEDPATGET